MDMEFRVFTPAEANEVDPEGVVWPSDAIIQYALDDEGIAGRAALLPLPHIEGLYVRENKQGSTLAYRLVHNLEKLVAADGRSHILAFVLDNEPEHARKLEGVGYEKLPITVWAKKVREV